MATPRDGAIVAREACRPIAEPTAFAAAVDEYYRADIVKAGLGAALDARPLADIFGWAENQRLLAASADGRCERVTYASGGLRVVGFVVRPSGPGPHPVILWLRGGNRDFGKVAPVTLLNLLKLADAGFVVLAPQYRGADGGEGADEFGGADVDDVLALVPLAATIPGTDPARLFVLGGSRGAMMGLLALRRGLPARAAAFRGGLFDLPRVLAARPELADVWRELIPGFDADRERVLAARSGVGWAGEARVPTLVVHGRQDWRAPVIDAERFDAALARAGVEHKLVIYEEDEHQLALHRDAWLAEVIAWFRGHGG